MSAIRYEKDQDLIVTLTMDMPNQSANTMNADFRAAFGECVARLLAEKDQISGVVLASAKKTFFAGGDLRELIAVTPADAESFFTMLGEKITRPLRQLETLGKPVVAAINGTALGGGWELCLACHARVAVRDERTQLGLPEVTFVPWTESELIDRLANPDASGLRLFWFGGAAFTPNWPVESGG